MPDITAPSEAWKPIAGYETVYEVSDWGRVRRLPKGNILKASQAGRGYLRVTLSVNAVMTGKYVHHLVADAFLGARPSGFDVCHLNGDIADARLANLRYGTHHSNMRDSLRHKTHLSTHRTHCSKGHELTQDNVYRRFYKSADGGPRYRDRCKACMKVKSKIDYAAWKQRNGKN
jgi:hypothetical protein